MTGRVAGEDLALFARSIEHAVDIHSGAALDAALADLGWRDALATDTRAAVAVLFEAQGAANAASSALDLVLGRALDVEGGAVVLPPVSHWGAPATVAVDRLDVAGLTLTHGGTAERFVVVARTGASHVAFEVDAAALAPHRIDGIDPALGLVGLAGEVTGAREVGPVDWRAAVALGQRALGHELVGASRRMLEQARHHALDRIQFGRPIAMFQAVRHRLADALVAIEAADALLDTAWLDASPGAAAMAKAVAGRSARVTARHCQQVLAGIGFTTEHPFHRYFKRVLVLEQLLGSTRELTLALGREVLEQRTLPSLVPL